MKEKFTPNKHQKNMLDDLEPSDGILAIPPKKDMVRYNIAALFEYCDKKGIETSELTEEERKKFII